MHNLRRGFRNIWRSKMRTMTVALLVGLTMSLAVTMMAINGAVDEQLGGIEANVGTEIEVRPAGTFGNFGGGEPLLETAILGIENIPGIIKVAPVVAYQHMPRTGVAQGQEGLEEASKQRMVVMGIVPGQELRLIGGGIAELIQGRNFDSADDGQKVAVVGITFAEERELLVGSMVLVNEDEFQVVGIAEGSNRFANNSVFLPLSTTQKSFDMEGQLSQVYVTVDSMPNVEGVILSLQNLLGEGADVYASGEANLARVTEAMDMVRGTTGVGLWLALGTCGLVIFFTMLLTVRERQREIGVLKAIGSSNSDLLSGFAWEATALALIGVVVGLVLFMTVGQYFASSLMARIITQPAGVEGMIGGGMGGGRGGLSSMQNIARYSMQGGLITSQLGDVTVSFSVSLLLRSLVTALGLGLLGGLIPALYALRLRPAEVLRND